MNYNNQIAPNTINHSGTPLNGNKSHLAQQDTVTREYFDNRSTESSLLAKIKEMKNHIAHLENMGEQGKRELSRIIRTKDKFIAVLAHDLRGSFSSVLCALELIKIKLNHQNINDIEKYVDIAIDSANSSCHLLEDLLKWTFSHDQKNNFNPVKINLHEVITGELKGLSFPIMQKRITIKRKIPVNLIVTADIQMIKTVIRNIVGNAIKFTPNDGIITVSVSEHAQFMLVSVKDNGIGISTKARRNLFQLENIHSMPGTHNETGVGIGLLLCKEFVELHGGKIWVEEPVSSGSEFRFTLPHDFRS
jgi:two-component system, sensor histidine kinase and response regulator